MCVKMSLAEALRAEHSPYPEGAAEHRVFLACGFEPLHFPRFLAAHLRRLSSGERVAVETGLFGDIVASLQRAQSQRPDSIACLLEWEDLDPRLGLRRLGGWSPHAMEDVARTVTQRLASIDEALAGLADGCRVAVSLPTLPLPPLAFTPPRQESALSLALMEAASRFARQAGGRPNVRIVSAQWLDRQSPLSERRDLRSEFEYGFPYQLPHASVLAHLLAAALRPPAPRKGLITDLDNTFWRGILGDDGVQGISWHLETRSQIHGIYQQLLASLAESGTLVAVASKNDATLVDEAFTRGDLLCPRSRLFPLEAHWQPKSESVARVLDAWNVGPESVVFVDDNALELAEVKQVHPEVECLLFPAGDLNAAYELCQHLRDSFARERLTTEDRLRAASLQAGAQFRTAAGGASLDRLLEEVQAEVEIDMRKHPADPRAVELVNKTNQFNLNGIRLTESAWGEYLQRPGAFLMTLSYSDKFGALGKVAVVAGRVVDGRAYIDTWVMSCRAFSRRIEHQTVAQLFARAGVTELEFAFLETPRNSPLREFLQQVTGAVPMPGCRLSQPYFAARCPALHHQVRTIEE